MALTMSIDFAANIARLEENSKKAADAVGQMADRIDSSASFAKSALIGLAGAFSVAAFTAAIKGSIDLADSLNDLSKKTGASVETLSGLRLAAEQSGTSLEAIANGSKKLATSMTEHKEAFASLGINTTNQTEALIQLGDVFAGMSDPVQRSALAVKIFGKSGDEMIPMLMEGSEGIRRMIERGQELGGITTEMARQADQFNDSMAEMKLRSQGFYITLANQLLPSMNETVSAFNDLNESGAAAVNIGKGIATVFETVVIVAANVGYVFKQTGNEIGGIAAQLAALATGDFKAFKTIGEEMKRDAEIARQELDKFEQRIMGAGKNKPERAADSGGTDARGDQLLKAMSGEAKALEALLMQVNGLNGSFLQDWDNLNKLFQAGKLSVDELTAAQAELLKKQPAIKAEADIVQNNIASWVRYADAVLAEGERVDEMLRKQIERQNEVEASRELAWQQGVAARLASIQASNLTEEEVALAHLTQIQNDLQFALDMRFITEQQYNEMMLQERIKHEAKMGNVMAQGALARQKFTQMTAVQQTQTVLGEMVRMTAGVATQNRAMFEINKVAALAQAAIALPASVMKAFAAYPPPISFVMGGLALAAGLAQLDAINSAQFGSSTSAPSVGGGAATPVTSVDPGGGSAMPLAAVPEAVQPRQQIDFHFTGSQISMDQMVNEFIPRLEEAYNNGAGGGAVFNVTQN